MLNPYQSERRWRLGVNAAAKSAILSTRVIATGTGLSGGGDLSADRTLSITSIITAAGPIGSATAVPVVTYNAQGQLTAVTTAALPVLTSGTYTPGLTNSANISSSSALQCQYMRIGSVVTVSGGVMLTPTLLATLTTLGIALPIASTLSATNNLGGTAASSSVASNVGPVFADTSNNRATLQLISVGTGSETFSFSFTYVVQ